MGIYIKGMEMPTSCGDCKAFVCYRQWAGDVGDCFCGITKNDAKAKEKNADCPLVPVSQHGRLGDLDRLVKEVRDMAKEFPPNSISAERYRLFAEIIKTVPTIIPAEESKV